MVKLVAVKNIDSVNPRFARLLAEPILDVFEPHPLTNDTRRIYLR
jgi:hypothetical protein